MKVHTKSLMNPWSHGTLLFDLETDPRQEHPLEDDDVELRMVRLLAELMHASDAPASQFARLGLPVDTLPTEEHLLVRRQAERAAAALELLPPLAHFHAGGSVLEIPILELLQDPDRRTVIERHLPHLVATELVNIPAQLTLYQIARVTPIPLATLRALAEELAPVPAL
jgi:hypothetical protein